MFSFLRFDSYWKDIEMSELVNGDVVVLKSGGPEMTIDTIGKMPTSAMDPNKPYDANVDFAWVSWVNNNGDQKKDCFPLTSLKKYETPRKIQTSPPVRRRLAY